MAEQNYHVSEVAHLTPELADLLKEADALAEACQGFVERLHFLAAIDKRWASIGRTDLQTGFMAIRRSIIRPNKF